MSELFKVRCDICKEYVLNKKMKYIASANTWRCLKCTNKSRRENEDV